MVKKEKEDPFSILKAAKRLNSYVTLASENTLANVDDWIDTGCYALNAIISGSVYNGVPYGRLTGFIGPSGCGKSMLVATILGKAQEKGLAPVMFDTENAFTSDFAQAFGCDPSKVLVFPERVIENCRNQLSRVINDIIANGKQKEFIIAMDSLGMLYSLKEHDDSLENKNVSDMGLRAKVLGTLIKVALDVDKAKIPFVYTNHIYETMDRYPTLYKTQAGGSKILYSSSLIVQMTAVNRKTIEKKKTSAEKAMDIIYSNDKEEDIDEEQESEIDLTNETNDDKVLSKIRGIEIHAMTAKNRFTLSTLDAVLYLDYKKGLDKYFGLKEIAQKCGVLTSAGTIWSFNNKKIGKMKEWNNPEFWEENLALLDEVIKERFSYSNKKLDDYKKEILILKSKAENITNETTGNEQTAD